MNYTRTAVYNFIRNTVAASFPNVYITSRYVAKPPSFPACLIREIDRSRPLQNTQLDFKDVQWESVFEVQVVSAKANMASAEAYDIMGAAREGMSSLYYREFSETSVDSGDTFSIIGRFRRVIGGGDTMPDTINQN